MGDNKSLKVGLNPKVGVKTAADNYEFTDAVWIG